MGLKSLNTCQIRSVVCNDLGSHYRRVAVILTLVFFVLFWFLVFKSLNDGVVRAFEEKKEISLLFFWLFEVNPDQLCEAPSTFLFLYSVVALLSTHFFVIFMTSDQTASEIGNRYLRYLVTRCGRIELFLGRLISSLLIAGTLICACSLGAVIAMVANHSHFSLDAIIFIFSTSLWLFLSSIPFVSLSAFISAVGGSVALTMLCTSSLAFLLPKAFDFIEIKWSQSEWVFKLRTFFPGGVSNAVLGGDAGALTIFVSLLYLLIFGWMGCKVFETRELP